MRYAVADICLELNEAEPAATEQAVLSRLAQRLGVDASDVDSYTCVRRALDARRKNRIRFVCSDEVELGAPLAEPLPAHVRAIERSILESPCPKDFPRPAWLAEPLAEGFHGFGRKMKGYVTEDANLLAIESRTSSPVRINRDESMQSLSAAGLYPVGEGAGYAGGIVSAAVDGLKAAEAIIRQQAS